MTKAKMRCYIIYNVTKRGHKNVTCLRKKDGLTATVHATSKKRAKEILVTAGLGEQFSFSRNHHCDPTHLTQGDHCIHNLIAKDPTDPTPLGSIPPNSPEWDRRIETVPPKINPDRLALIEQVRQRKDIGDPD